MSVSLVAMLCCMFGFLFGGGIGMICGLGLGYQLARGDGGAGRYNARG